LNFQGSRFKPDSGETLKLMAVSARAGEEAVNELRYRRRTRTPYTGKTKLRLAKRFAAAGTRRVARGSGASLRLVPNLSHRSVDRIALLCPTLARGLRNQEGSITGTKQAERAGATKAITRRAPERRLDSRYVMKRYGPPTLLCISRHC
jgi:hypothetical protein